VTAITKQRLSGFVGTALPFDDITMLARSNATETGGSLSPCLAAQPSRGRLVLLSLNHQTASGRIAFLSALAASDHGAQARLSALQQGLNELGWVEGRNLRLDFRWGIAERDQMQETAVTALVQETKTIPHRVREQRTMADLAPQPGGGLIILPDAFTVGH
jgi:hypothetical protein